MRETVLKREILSNYNYFEKFLTYLPNPDELLLGTPLLDEVFQEMMLDPHIFAKTDQVKKALDGKELILQSSGNEKIDKFLKEFIDNEVLNELIEYGADSYPYGFSVVEIIWELKDGYWVPAKFKKIKNEFFRFNADGELIYLNEGKFDKVNTEYKVIVFKNNPSHDYGEPVLTKCYWSWMFKKAGLRFWLTTAEKFGVPTILSIFKEENIERAKKKAKLISEALSKIKNDAALALANVDKIETVESKGTGDDFRLLIDLCNMEISKAITGEVLTSDVAKTGTYAQAKVQRETFKERVNGIAEKITKTINQTFLKWLVELNFGKDAPLPTIKADKDLIADWEIIKDAIDRGFPVSKSALYKKFNIPAPIDDNDAFINPKIANEGGMAFSDFLLSTLQRRKTLKH